MDTPDCTVPHAVEHPTLRAMFEARKRVFVDLLGWDVPVLAGRYEIDEFDTPDAAYVLMLDTEGRHRASARLLRTERPHILGDLFPSLCAGPVPRGVDVREITRFCIDPDCSRGDQRDVRNALVSALVRHAANCGIRTYTAVAGLAWFRQISRFGWECSSLGEPRKINGELLVGLRITVRADTIGRLAAKGVWREPHNGVLRLHEGALS